MPSEKASCAAANELGSGEVGWCLTTNSSIILVTPSFNLQHKFLKAVLMAVTLKEMVRLVTRHPTCLKFVGSLNRNRLLSIGDTSIVDIEDDVCNFA